MDFIEDTSSKKLHANEYEMRMSNISTKRIDREQDRYNTMGHNISLRKYQEEENHALREHSDIVWNECLP